MTGTVALIVAAGRGERAAISGSSPDFPKQYRALAGIPVLRHSVAAFLSRLPRDAVYVVIRNQDRALHDGALAGMTETAPIIGGSARQDSVRLGLEGIAARATPDKVLIHDAARPFVSPLIIARVVDALDSADAVAGTSALRRFENHRGAKIRRTNAGRGLPADAAQLDQFRQAIRARVARS